MTKKTAGIQNLLLLILIGVSFPGFAQSTPDTLTLTFLGDLMAHTPTTAMRQFDQIYAGLGGALWDDDLTFANLETPVDPSIPYATYPRFNVHPPFLQAAVNAGIDVFSLANNHTNDHGATSALATLDSLEALDLAGRQPVWWSGIRRDTTEGFRITEIDLPGWKIGFVSFTDFLNDYTGFRSVYLVPFWEAPSLDAFVALVRQYSENFDLFVVAYHGGTEYVLEPPARIQRTLDRLYAAGAQIVWGHHPHVIQPWQPQYSPDSQDQGEIEGLIMPSMGNFISGQTWRLGPGDGNLPRAYTGDSALLRVVVNRNPQTRKITLEIPPARLISTENRPTGTYVRFTEDLAKTPGPWQEFFRIRLRAMKNLTGL